MRSQFPSSGPYPRWLPASTSQPASSVAGPSVLAEQAAPSPAIRSVHDIPSNMRLRSDDAPNAEKRNQFLLALVSGARRYGTFQSVHKVVEEGVTTTLEAPIPDKAGESGILSFRHYDDGTQALAYRGPNKNEPLITAQLDFTPLERLPALMPNQSLMQASRSGSSQRDRIPTRSGPEHKKVASSIRLGKQGGLSSDEHRAVMASLREDLATYVKSNISQFMWCCGKAWPSLKPNPQDTPQEAQQRKEELQRIVNKAQDDGLDKRTFISLNKAFGLELVGPSGRPPRNFLKLCPEHQELMIKLDLKEPLKHFVVSHFLGFLEQNKTTWSEAAPRPDEACSKKFVELVNLAVKNGTPTTKKTRWILNGVFGFDLVAPSRS